VNCLQPILFLSLLRSSLCTGVHAFAIADLAWTRGGTLVWNWFKVFSSPPPPVSSWVEAFLSHGSGSGLLPHRDSLGIGGFSLSVPPRYGISTHSRRHRHFAALYVFFFFSFLFFSFLFSRVIFGFFDLTSSPADAAENDARMTCRLMVTSAPDSRAPV
jgi:hypothetical protein